MHLFAFQCNEGNQHIITFIQSWHKPFSQNSYTFNHSLALEVKGRPWRIHFLQYIFMQKNISLFA